MLCVSFFHLQWTINIVIEVINTNICRSCSLTFSIVFYITSILAYFFFCKWAFKFPSSYYANYTLMNFLVHSLPICVFSGVYTWKKNSKLWWYAIISHCHNNFAFLILPVALNISTNIQWPQRFTFLLPLLRIAGSYQTYMKICKNSKKTLLYSFNPVSPNVDILPHLFS